MKSDITKKILIKPEDKKHLILARKTPKNMEIRSGYRSAELATLQTLKLVRKGKRKKEKRQYFLKGLENVAFGASLFQGKILYDTTGPG